MRRGADKERDAEYDRTYEDIRARLESFYGAGRGWKTNLAVQLGLVPSSMMGVLTGAHKSWPVVRLLQAHLRERATPPPPSPINPLRLLDDPAYAGVAQLLGYTPRPAPEPEPSPRQRTSACVRKQYIPYRRQERKQ